MLVCVPQLNMKFNVTQYDNYKKIFKNECALCKVMKNTHCNMLALFAGVYDGKKSGERDIYPESMYNYGNTGEQVYNIVKM